MKIGLMKSLSAITDISKAGLVVVCRLIQQFRALVYRRNAESCFCEGIL